MRIVYTGFLGTHSWIMGLGAKITDAEFRTLITLTNNHGPFPIGEDGRIAHMGKRKGYLGDLEAIAKAMGKSEASVRRALVSLQSKGFVACIPQFDGSGAQLRSIYVLEQPA